MRAGYVPSLRIGKVSGQTPLQLGNGSAASPSYSFVNDPNTGLYGGAAIADGFVGFSSNGAPTFTYGPNEIRLGSGKQIGWSSNADPTIASADTVITRSAAGIIAITTGIALGTNTSSVGSIRLANNTAIAFRNAANSADLVAIDVTSGDIIRIGSGTYNVQIVQSGSGLLGFFGTSPIVKQASGENLTNNVTAGGVNGTVANYTDLVTYANDAAAIRNDIHQLSRKLKQVNDALRAYGILT